jgi:NADH-quinone oxidoreductase subunit J
VILFAVLAAVLIASAFFTISAKKPVYSVVGLLVNFLALAVLYLSLSAEFMAVIQIVVYSGAILVLFVFVIALLSSGVGPFSVGPDRMPRALVPAAVLSFICFALVLFGLAHTPFLEIANVSAATNTGAPGLPNVFGSVADFGATLFTAQLLPFEVTALILMVAVVGVVLLAGDASLVKGITPRRRPRASEREPIVKAKAKS